MMFEGIWDWAFLWEGLRHDINKFIHNPLAITIVAGGVIVVGFLLYIQSFRNKHHIS